MRPIPIRIIEIEQLIDTSANTIGSTSNKKSFNIGNHGVKVINLTTRRKIADEFLARLLDRWTASAELTKCARERASSLTIMKYVSKLSPGEKQ